MNKRGYTIIDLGMIVAIVIMLVVVAMPSFFDFAKKVNDVALNNILEAVKSTIPVKKAECILMDGEAPGGAQCDPRSMYYTKLGDEEFGDCALDNPCFEYVLATGIMDNRVFSKGNGMAYLFRFSDGLKACVYNKNDGLFVCNPI